MPCRNLWQGFEGICGLAGKCIQVHRQESQGSFCWGYSVGLEGSCPGPDRLVHPCPAAGEGKGRDALRASPARAQGPCPAALPSPDLTAHGHKHNLLPSAQGGDSPIPSDKSRVKAIPWDCQVPSKAPGAAGARVLRRILGVQITPAFSSWTSSFPLAGAAGKYVWACLAECCHMLQEGFCNHSSPLCGAGLCQGAGIRISGGCSAPWLPPDRHSGMDRKGERRMGNGKSP